MPPVPAKRVATAGSFKPGNQASVGNRGKTLGVERRFTQKQMSNAIDAYLQKSCMMYDGKTRGRNIDKLVDRLFDIAYNGEDGDSMKAITEIINRHEGKPAQAIEHSMNPERPLEMIHRTMTPAEASRIYQEYLRRGED